MLINNIPIILRDIEEFKVLFASLDIEVEQLKDSIGYHVKQSNILQADEDRVKAWESFLKIEAQGNLDQRRLYIIASLTSVGKLNKAKIEEIVNIYTNGGGAIVSFDNSTITVKVKPPVGSEILLFTDVERTLEGLKPAHIALSVIRFYSTFKDIKEDFATFGEVRDRFTTFEDMKNYIKP